MKLPDDVKEQVKQRLTELVDPVEIVFSEDSSAPLNNDIKELLEDLVSLSDKLSLRFDDSQPLKPGFELVGKNKGKVRFAGIPSGHEFATLLEDLIMLSKGEHGLSPETVSFLESLDKPLNLKVFVTPTCPYCPMAVLLAHRMAMVSDKVDASMVEAGEFPDLSNKFRVSGVPHTIVNDKDGGFVGAHPEQSAVSEIKKYL